MAKKIEVIVDVNTEKVEISSDRVLTLTEQVRILKKEIQKAGPGPEQDLLISKYNEVSDELDKVNLKSREFLGALSTLPGPVGQFAGSLDGAVNQLRDFSSFSFKDIKTQLGGLVDDFGKIVTNIGKATGITKLYTTLNNALAASFVKVGVGEEAAAIGARAFSTALVATGVGAFVVALGFLVSKLMEYTTQADKSAEAQKELNKQMAEGTQAGTDAAIKFLNQSEKLEVQRAKNAGKTEAQIQSIREDYAKRREDQLKKNLEALQKIQGTDTTKAADALFDEQQNNLQQREEYNGQVIERQKAANQKLLEKNKQYQEEVKADNKTADQTLIDLKRENAALAIKDERARQDKELENQKIAEEEKIKVLKISQEKKNEIIGQIETKYKAKQTAVDDKRKEEDLKAQEDFNRKVADIKTAAIKDETQRSIAERQNKLTNDLADLEKDKEFIKKSEKEKAQIRKDLTTASENDILKIKIESKLRQDALEKGDRDSRTARIMAGAQNDLDLQRKTLEEKKIADDKYYAEQLSKEGLTADQIRELNERKLADQIQYTEKSNQIERDRVAVRQKALDDIISIAGAESDVGRAALVAKQILLARELFLEIKRTITFSQQAAARSVVAVAEGTAQTAKIGFPQNIPMLIGYAAQAVAIISAISSAVKSAKSSASEGTDVGSAPPTQNLGRNYGDGGYIEGPRHAAGGVMINAEGGEAVMTRGAVTMFGPLLSTLNQMGGGTSFSSGATGGARPDNAARENPAAAQEPMIMKTYVVSNELTTEAEKQARLKDLSTL